MMAIALRMVLNQLRQTNTAFKDFDLAALAHKHHGAAGYCSCRSLCGKADPATTPFPCQATLHLVVNGICSKTRPNKLELQ